MARGSSTVFEGSRSRRPALDEAKESVAAAMAIADMAPPDTQTAIADAASTAFIDGLSTGSVVAAVTAVVGAVAALKFLPAHGVQPIVMNVATKTADVELVA